MAMGKKLRTEVVEWSVLAMVVVVVSVILLNFKSQNVGNMTCDSAHVFNSTGNICCNGTSASFSCAGTENQTTINALASTTDTFVTALSTPATWVSIVIIGLVGFGLIYLFNKKNQ